MITRTFPLARWIRRALAVGSLAALALGPRLVLSAEPSDETLRTPENQVFQFMQRDSFEYAPDNRVNATAYLWIPEHCRHLRGLLIMGQNVTEHTLVGHPAIRAACAANDLGIVWSTPSYFSTKNKDHARTVAFLQKLLNSLASTSGYAEVATVPWLPVGESGHLLMVDALLDGAPERCIAGIYVKNAHWFCTNRRTPILVFVGTAQEWDQDKVDIRSRWKTLDFYGAFLKERAAHPDWPASLYVDGGSGHFDCPEAMARYFADYIAAVSKARIPADPSQPLVPVDLSAGFTCGLRLPGQPEEHAVSSALATDRRRPWFFTRDLAEASLEGSSINWSAQSQVPAYLDSTGKPVAMTFRGVTNPVPLVTGADGISFEIRAALLPAIPPNFVGAGEPLARTPGDPSVEWLCGPIAPVGGGRFRICLDRTWPQSPVCVAARKSGTDSVRAAVQPGYLTLKRNTEGVAQTIAFDPLPDVRASVGSLPLVARSSSGMPVEFFVVAGPATVDHGRLLFTTIPPRTRLPVRVSVTAWQWGRAVSPQVQTASPVTESFNLIGP